MGKPAEFLKNVQMRQKMLKELENLSKIIGMRKELSFACFVYRELSLAFLYR